MVIFSGYGLFIVLVDYFGGLFLISKFSSYLFTTEKQQYFALIAFHLLITIFNFFLAKYLNREEVRHTVYRIKLETFVLAAGAFLLVPMLLMIKDILY
ncbi:MAG: hypothetical protein ACTTKS_04325 [Bulleidia sp.]